jgi:parallel beta-helix repeat protein
VRNSASLLALLLLFSIMWVSIPQIGLVKAQRSSIFIRSDGSVEGTSKIQVDGNRYILTGNITVDTSHVDHGIYVEKDNIIMDGLGYTLQGNGEATGIQLHQRIGVEIKNFHIINWGCGINNPQSECVIEGNWITECNTGVNLADTHNCTFIGNELLGNREDIFLIRGYANTFLDNNIGKLYWSTGFLVPGENYFDGNYWGEYEGADEDKDSFGDTPFMVYQVEFGDTNITCYDNHPLIEPAIIPEFPSWAILPLVITATLVAIIYKKQLTKNRATNKSAILGD